MIKYKGMGKRITYIMYNSVYDLYKIGITRDIKERKREIARNHNGTTLLCIIPYDIERALHNKFKDKNVKVGKEKEWFNLNDRDLRYLGRVSKMDKNSLININDSMLELDIHMSKYNVRGQKDRQASLMMEMKSKTSGCSYEQLKELNKEIRVLINKYCNPKYF